jgi:hypothetical protein
MNVELGTETAQFPEKEYINGIFLAVYPAENSILPCSPLHFMLLAVQYTVYRQDWEGPEDSWDKNKKTLVIFVLILVGIIVIL